MDASPLKEIGLTQREIKVYLALLELGSSSSGGIIKKSGIPNSKIYETLDKLIQKGLVSFILKGNKRHYQASDPKVIIDFLEEKKKAVQAELLPRLEGLYNSKKEENEAVIYEGIKGIKAVFERVLKELKPGDTILALGVPKKGNEILGPFLDNYNKRRVKNRIGFKVIYNQDAKQYLSSRKRMPLTHVKMMAEKTLLPAWVDVFGDYVIIFNVSESPRAFLIKDKSIASNFKLYFEAIWNSIK